MKHITFIVAATLAVASLAASGQQPESVLRGTVVRARTSEPIGGVEVTLTPARSGGGPLTIALGQLSGTPAVSLTLNVIPLSSPFEPLNGPPPPNPFRAITDADGRFEIINVPDGAYVITGRRDGYLGAQTLWSAFPQGTSVPLIVGPQRQVELQMILGGSIAGSINDAQGKPVAGAAVAPYQIAYRDGRPTLAQRGPAQNSNARGEYRLSGLPPGESIVGVYPPRPTGPGPAGRGLRSYYPGTVDLQATAPITVTEGANLGGINIAIPDVQTFSIKGRAINSLPQQPARLLPNGDVDPSVATFALAPRNAVMTEDLVSEFPNVLTTEDARRMGEFEIRGVRPGLYDLFPMVRVLLNGQLRMGTGRIPVEVRQQDVSGLTLLIHPGVDVKGRVRIVGDAIAVNPEPPRISLRSLDNTPEIIATLGVGAQPADSSGTFVISNVGEGTFGVNVARLPDNGYIADIRQGNISVFDSGIVVGKTPPDPIEVIVNTGGQVVEGVLLNASGKAVPEAVVVLTPPADRRRNSALFRVAISDAEGRFKLTGVSPGNYKIFSWESVPPTAWQNAAFMSKYEQQGRELRVGNSPTDKVQLVVIPAPR